MHFHKSKLRKITLIHLASCLMYSYHAMLEDLPCFHFLTLQALYFLLKFVKEQNIQNIKIMGDSQFVINSMNNVIIAQNLLLGNLIEDLKSIVNTFQSVNFEHFYRESNQEADSLSKKGLDMI